MKETWMKVLFPRNIEKGLLAGLTFRFGPISVSLIQLLLLAVGAAAMLGTVNSLMKAGFNKVIAIMFSSPILLIFAIIAFFKVSELSLVPFLCKFVRNRFFDTMKKFQCNFPKINGLTLFLLKSQEKEKKEEIKYKENKINKELLEKMTTGGLV